MKRVAGAIVIAAAAGCADFDGVVNPTGGLPDVVVEIPQFQRDIAPIFERRCGIGGCHSESRRQGNLVLTRASGHAAIVNQPSSSRQGEVLVRPGDGLNSWLVIAVAEDQSRRQGLPRMPLASGPLTPNQVQTIVNWINRGAPND